jgi:hypothetical protein
MNNCIPTELDHDHLGITKIGPLANYSLQSEGGKEFCSRKSDLSFSVRKNPFNCCRLLMFRKAMQWRNCFCRKNGLPLVGLVALLF